MFKQNQLIVIVLLFVFLIACNTTDTDSLKKELFAKFLNNPEKEESASFLLNNFDERKHYKGKKYEKYIQAISTFSNNADTLESILSKFSPLSKNSMERDVHALSVEDLANEINNAYFALSKAKWGNKITKSDFRNYVLPYKINNAKLENWRDSVWADYGDTAFQFNTIQEAALYLINRTTILRKNFKVKMDTNLPDLPYSSLKKIPFGTCKELSDYITFILRAYAIPCVQDFTPNYTNLWTGHYWNAIINEFGEDLPFVIPMEVDTLGHFKSESYQLGKVYRVLFEKNTQNFTTINKENSYLPNIFNNEYLSDVTDEYINTKNVSIQIIQGKRNKGLVCLSVYDNKNWKPIAMGKVNENEQKAFFKNVGVESIYLPIAINKESKSYLNYPFILHEDGEIEKKYPNKDSLITLNILRKFPLVARIKYFINRMKGGYFEVANRIDFKDSKTIYKIMNLEDEYFQNVKLDLVGRYRYIRYMSPSGSFCNVAELEFYDSTKNILKGDLIANSGVHPNFPDRTKEKAFDGDILTFFHAERPDSCWIGMDFKIPQQISEIKYIPRNGNNIIVPGNIYEVFYWDNKWVSLGKKEATNHALVYENVPSNAVYFIHNHSGGKEERIFTYKEDQQIWW